MTKICKKCDVEMTLHLLKSKEGEMKQKICQLNIFAQNVIILCMKINKF